MFAQLAALSPWLSLPLIGLLPIACKTSSLESDTSALVATKATWPNPQSIPLCFVNPQAVDKTLIDDLKSFASSEYAKAGLQFTGWGTCKEEDLQAVMIRVRMNLKHEWEGQAATAGGGLSMVGSTNMACAPCEGATMLLDVGTKGRYPKQEAPLRDFIIDQTRGAFLHELGHALGLHHEHARSDAPTCQNDTESVPEDRAAGLVYVGSYDPDSIMNYCRNKKISSLSSGDLAGLRHLYPAAKAPGAPQVGHSNTDAKAKTPGAGNNKVPGSAPAEAGDPCNPATAKSPSIGGSSQTGPSMEVVLENRCHQTLAIHWLDPQGKSVRFGTIEPVREIKLSTYQEHAWNIHDAKSGKLLKELRIAPWMSRIQVP